MRIRIPQRVLDLDARGKHETFDLLAFMSGNVVDTPALGDGSA